MPDNRRPSRVTTIRSIAAWMVGLVFLAPFLWLVITALKPASETFSFSVAPLTLTNFHHVLVQVPLLRYMGNTAFVAVIVTVVALVFHSMAAYALARLRFRGNMVILNLVVATFMVSTPVILVPLYIITRQLGLLDSLWGVIVPGIFNAFGIFLLRQVMISIPKELEESATLDGAGDWRKYTGIILPLIKPTLASLAVLFFLANWNAFMWPRTILADQKLWMVQQGLSSMQGQYGSQWHNIAAAAVVVALPTLIMFLIFQRFLVKSIMISGLK